ncbi:MAG TPA: K(+)-transporting ATPase subunit C [Kofleriaceae bacterium]|jgi:K+-transporting ATPase ATPase C chain|nr:K(+)-transporting ATPase subunit C [Kofleriaceae bacterium]
MQTSLTDLRATPHAAPGEPATTGMSQLVVALRATLVTLVVTGLLYPLVITGLAQVMFPHRANGSIVTDDNGREVGSELIGQGFADPAYLHARPSAGSYDAANSGGTNLAVTSKKLRDGQPDDPATKDTDESFTGVVDLVAAYRKDNGLADSVPVPADAVSRSASGLDPHVSPENAALQAARIARARNVAALRVQAIIEQHTEGRELGFLGEPRVNVLELNLALDRSFGAPAHAAEGGAAQGK